MAKLKAWKSFLVFMVLMLVLSLGAAIVPASPAGAVADPVIKALKWDGGATTNPTFVYYYYYSGAGTGGSIVNFTVTSTPAGTTAVTADFTSLGGSDNVSATGAGASWEVTWNWSTLGAVRDPGAYNIPVSMTTPGGTTPIGVFVVVNINPLDLPGIGLGGETTNWKTGIADFTNVTNLTFEMGPAGSLGKLVIHGPVNLCDQTTATALADLGNNLSIAAAETSLNTAVGALAAFQGGATLYMYNLPFTEMPSIVYTPDGGTPQTVVLGGTGTILNDTLIASYNYNAGTGTLTLTVKKWSTYNAVAAPAAAPAAPKPRASATPPRPLNPAQMSVRYLSVSPQQTSANQPVTISTNVVNTGDEAGNYNVALKINGQVEQSKTVSVGPQGTQPVKLTVTKAQPGTYTVDIGGQKGSFVVLGAGGTAGAPVSGGLIAILIMGVLILATVVVLLISRRPA